MLAIPACGGSGGSNPPPLMPQLALLVVHVVDADSAADVPGATVTLAPGGATGLTDDSGRVAFTNLVDGAYDASVSVQSLVIGPSETIAVGPPVSGHSTSPVTVTTGITATTRVAVDRLDDGDFNLVALHRTGTAGFNNPNCVACHTNRRSERSDDPAIVPWHAIGGAENGHASLQCTSCHNTTVDLIESSGATIRKQVYVATVCTICHPHYPSSY